MSAFFNVSSKSLLRCITSNVKCLNPIRGHGMRSLPLEPFGVRFLFSNEVLGIDRYIDVRNRVTSQFRNVKENFFTQMNKLSSDDDNNIVFTEDLKNIIYMINDTDEEIELFQKMLHKFESQNASLRFGTFVFGPVVMRMIHHLQKCDLAMALLKDPKFHTFFNQISSVTLAMDLLWKHQRYDDIIDLFEYIKENVPFETKYPRDTILLVIGACYKINTPESYNYALNLLKNAKEVGAQVTRKAVTLFAALALNQKEPNTALEVLSIAIQTNYITVRNLRIMALSEIGRLQDALNVLRLIANRDVPSDITPEEILPETIDRVKNAVNASEDKSLIQEYSQIEKALIEGKHIQNITLDALLTSPVRPAPQRRDFRSSEQFSFRNRMPPNEIRDNNKRMRQGLTYKEME